MENIEHIIRQPTDRTRQTPLLLQHRAWHGAWCWELWLDYFASLGYEVHAISWPGHGHSPLKKRHINLYTLGDYVDTLANAVRSISPTPIVIGHSMGAAVLQKYLERHHLPQSLSATVWARRCYKSTLRDISYPLLFSWPACQSEALCL